MRKVKDIELEIENLLSINQLNEIDQMITEMENSVNERLELHILLTETSLHKYINEEKKKLIYSDDITLLKRLTKHLCEISINFVKQRRDNYWSKISNELNKHVEKSILDKFSYLEERFEEHGVLVDNIHSLEKIAEADPKFTHIGQVEDLAKGFTSQNIEEEKLNTVISKIAALQMTGLLDHLYENEDFKNSDNKLAGFLSKLLEAKKSSIQPILSAIKSHKSIPDHYSKNNPFNKKEATNKLTELLESLGFDSTILQKNTP